MGQAHQQLVLSQANLSVVKGSLPYAQGEQSLKQLAAVQEAFTEQVSLEQGFES